MFTEFGKYHFYMLFVLILLIDKEEVLVFSKYSFYLFQIYLFSFVFDFNFFIILYYRGGALTEKNKMSD